MCPHPLALALWRTAVVAVSTAMAALVVAAHLLGPTAAATPDLLAEQPGAEAVIPRPSR